MKRVISKNFLIVFFIFLFFRNSVITVSQKDEVQRLSLPCYEEPISLRNWTLSTCFISSALQAILSCKSFCELIIKIRINYKINSKKQDPVINDLYEIFITKSKHSKLALERIFRRIDKTTTFFSGGDPLLYLNTLLIYIKQLIKDSEELTNLFNSIFYIDEGKHNEMIKNKITKNEKFDYGGYALANDAYYNLLTNDIKPSKIINFTSSIHNINPKELWRFTKKVYSEDKKKELIIEYCYERRAVLFGSIGSFNLNLFSIKFSISFLLLIDHIISHVKRGDNWYLCDDSAIKKIPNHIEYSEDYKEEYEWSPFTYSPISLIGEMSPKFYVYELKDEKVIAERDIPITNEKNKK